MIINAILETGEWQRLFMASLQFVLYRSEYRQTSKIRCTLVGNKIVDHSDVVGSSAAPTTSPFAT